MLLYCAGGTSAHEIGGGIVGRGVRDLLKGLYIAPPPQGSNLDITSFPDALSIQVQGGTGTPQKTTIEIKVTSAAAKTLRAGRPLKLTLKGTFRAPGKAPVTASRKITLQGPVLKQPPPSPAITSVTFNGSQQNPSFVVRGQNLGKKPAPNPSGSPSNRPPLCPVTIQGNAGLDYGTSLYIADDARRLAAGRYRPSISELDCIGLIVTRFTSTEVDYRLGAYYAQVYPQYPLTQGDAVQVAVNGAAKTVHVKYGATVTG